MHSQELWRKRQVCSLFGIDPSTLYRNIKAGKLPKPIRVGRGSSRWLRSEVEACLQAMIGDRP
jgi:predicted DNA-binding transcriptional regulator AlpA